MYKLSIWNYFLAIGSYWYNWFNWFKIQLYGKTDFLQFKKLSFLFQLFKSNSNYFWIDGNTLELLFSNWILLVQLVQLV